MFMTMSSHTETSRPANWNATPLGGLSSSVHQVHTTDNMKENNTFAIVTSEQSANTTASFSLMTSSHGDEHAHYKINGGFDYGDFTNFSFDEEEYFNNVEQEVATLPNKTYDFDVYDFERIIYVYIWPILVIVTSLTNILVVTVLLRKKMRNATNIILVAIAISDSLTGLVTLPVFLPAYGSYKSGPLIFTKSGCETFMFVKYFVSRAFHTISIWLTVILGLQRVVSVRFPFRVNTLFSISRTTIAIVFVAVLSPFLHLYHAFDSKTEDQHYCVWDVEEKTCDKGCIYLWLILFLMHFLPCVFLIIFCSWMIRTMQTTTERLRKSHMVSNPENINRRFWESKRISAIVFVVLVVFLIPEVPYTVFLFMFLIKHHSDTAMPFMTNRIVTCAYEVCVVLSFHANFWTYLVMNRKFRQGLRDTLIDPVFGVLAKVGLKHIQSRPRTMSFSSSIRTVPSDIFIPNGRLSRSNSCQPNWGQFERRPSQSHSNTYGRNSTQLEMKTYSFRPRENSVK